MRRVALCLVVAIAALPTPGEGQAPIQQACTDGVISEVLVRSQDPYGEDATAADATFGWAFRTLNWLHLETKDQVIRWELLFSEGSCFDSLRLSESERALRSLPYLQSASVTSRRLDDGSHRVEVVTRDSWALSASLGVDFEEGVDVTGLQASYRNVGGYGLRTSFFRRAFRERLRYGGLGRHTNLFGTRIDVVAQAGRTRAGRYATGTIQKPFLNEFADHAFRQVAARRDDYFGYALPPELGFTPAYLRYRADLVELTYQRRFGDTAGPRGLLGLGISHESFQVPQEPGSTRAVVDGDFDRTQEAPPAVRDALLAQAEPYATKRLTLYLGVRDVHYVLRQGLDAITALQDLMVGSSVTLALGRGFAVGVDDQSDLLARLQARVGVIGPSHYLQARTDVHARRPTGRALGAGSWRDVVGSVWADGYWSQSGWASLYVRGRASAGWNTQRPFQIRLGGREGIRAYTEDAFPGGQLVFGSVEQRFVLPVGPSFADLGFAFFADGGRTWAGDVPFGQDSGWQGGIGAGLRASPAGARRVFRVDATLPLGALRNERGVTLRIYGEIFGVLDRRRWPHQVDRSRWYGNDPDLSRRVPDPLARN